MRIRGLFKVPQYVGFTALKYITMRSRGRNSYFLYMVMVMVTFCFLNAYLARKQLHHDPRPLTRHGLIRKLMLDREAEAKARLALKPDIKNHTFNKRLITSKLPKVGYFPGNSTEAEKLFHRVRVLCWIPTSPYLFFKRSIYVLQTWGKRCNKLVFFVSKSKEDPVNWQQSLPISRSVFMDLNYSHYAQENLEFIEQNTTEKGNYDLSKKVFASWEHLSKHHADKADWFIKVDDDTYLIMENLRYFLSKQDPHKPVYYGHKFSKNTTHYHSGGAGYVMSRQTLDSFVHKYHNECHINSGTEDLQIGICLKNLSIETGESSDEKKRAYFHPFAPYITLSGKYPKWFIKYDNVSSKHEGIIGFPRLPISFHFVGENKMLELELFIYYIQVYGGALGNDTEEAFADGIVHVDPFVIVEQTKDHREVGGMTLKVGGNNTNVTSFGKPGHVRTIDRDKTAELGDDIKREEGNISNIDLNNVKGAPAMPVAGERAGGVAGAPMPVAGEGAGAVAGGLAGFQASEGAANASLEHLPHAVFTALQLRVKERKLPGRR